ncbi:hypothetical protein L0Z42_25385 [Burkholderia multivorans]|uniref:hypothetical protein n=1 Tax=Burkholderia multivorans TaxID=87883 RepID=UPI00201B493E|nr:hypothetical protein [Burkholderia multivorans]MCO1373833.1 hypothetical protein [Burkholderia multivorans]MCO1469463.1 hypothetical protein [Burkholderia multivorans]UQO82074.1 hypothetical protein L0Y86_06505 [Burkholderia multivorans]
MQATYTYDALGRRIAKLTEPVVPYLAGAGSGWRDAERRRLKQERGYGLTLYGWDGDTLAYETAWERRETTHYVYEPGSFTPLAQAKGCQQQLRSDPLGPLCSTLDLTHLGHQVDAQHVA